MCFSASVSFGTGAVLGVVGVLTVKKAQTPSQIPFASLPLLFSVQQIAEGLVWLSLTYKSYEGWGTFATHSFLFFAQVLWPIWVPFSIWLIEKDEMRKKILLSLTIVGVLLACYFAYSQFFGGVNAEIVSYHIKYSIISPLTLYGLGTFLYVMSTVIPSFVSSLPNFRMFGSAILVSLIFTKIFYTDYLISVWCFFAAVISMVILYLVTEMNKRFVVGQAVS
jgi:hypothetical protein